MNAYTIEYEVRTGPEQHTFGHVTITAPDAHSAVVEFHAKHPEADIRELRRVHVQDPA